MAYIHTVVNVFYNDALLIIMERRSGHKSNTRIGKR